MVPDPHSFFESGSGSRRAKLTHKNAEISSFVILDVLFLRDKDFNSLDVLYGGVGIRKFKFSGLKK